MLRLAPLYQGICPDPGLGHFGAVILFRQRAKSRKDWSSFIAAVQIHVSAKITLQWVDYDKQCLGIAKGFANHVYVREGDTGAVLAFVQHSANHMESARVTAHQVKAWPQCIRESVLCRHVKHIRGCMLDHFTGIAS